MNDKAFILGNGPDRPTDKEWLNNLEGDTYGCNAMYRDFEPDFLVANDWAMMVEIINSTYAYETAIHIGEQEDSSSFVFMGHSTSNQYHIIWLDESLQHIVWGLKPQFENMSTGLCAIQLALETGYDEIDVIGFSGLKDRNYQNIYDGTENYKFDPAASDKVRVPENYIPLDASHWESVYINLVKKYSEVKVNLI